MRREGRPFRRAQQARRCAQRRITPERLSKPRKRVLKDRFTAGSSVRTDNDRLPAARGTPAETPPKRREVGKNTAHLLHLVPAIKGKVRRDTIITVRVSPAANQKIGHAICDIHTCVPRLTGFIPA
jgi:hypothetical protein